jgi:hypothetical protein
MKKVEGDVTKLEVGTGDSSNPWRDHDYEWNLFSSCVKWFVSSKYDPIITSAHHTHFPVTYSATFFATHTIHTWTLGRLANCNGLEGLRKTMVIVISDERCLGREWNWAPREYTALHHPARPVTHALRTLVPCSANLPFHCYKRN